jgi:TetR/AcrR family fatty acid metabolism transcriptional regulator
VGPNNSSSNDCVRTKTPLLADKILSVAARLFATHRFHEARMEDIAAAAGVGKGTLYRYFKDKDELYLTLLSRAGEEYLARLHEWTARAEGPRARLEAAVATVLSYFDEHPHVFDVIQHAEALQRPGQELPWKKTREESMALFRGIITEAEETGCFRLRNPEMDLLMLLGGLRAVLRFASPPRPPDLARLIVDDFLGGAAVEQPAWKGAQHPARIA